MQDGRGVQKCAEVVRDLKPLASCRVRTQAHTQRSSFALVTAPINTSFEALHVQYWAMSTGQREKM